MENTEINWNLIGCNENGGLTHTVTESYSYTEALTKTQADEISTTIATGVTFGFLGSGGSLDESVSSTVTNSLSHYWDVNYSVSVSTEYTCEIYDSGEPFVKGCMWQLGMTTREELSTNGPLNWSPGIIKCTASLESPRCPPFTQCANEECTFCKELKFFSG